MDQKMTPVTIGGVYIHPNQGVPVVFLVTEQKEEVFAIFVGILEAQAIVLGWRELEAPRPLMVDLLKNVLTHDLGCTIERVVIHSVEKGAFIANITFRDKDGIEHIRDARPTDAIALALRTKAPIAISEQLLERSQFERENTKALLEYLEHEAKDSETALVQFKEELLARKKPEEPEEEE